jgi:acyl dehydratase
VTTTDTTGASLEPSLEAGAPPGPQVGDELPGLELDVTPTLIVGGALASRDFEEVHHDPAIARDRGSEDIFLNILTSNGLVLRLVTDWAGPASRIDRARIRLGIPAYAGDRLVLTGEVTAVDQVDGEAVVEVAVTGEVSTGTHVRGAVTVAIPESRA